MADKKISEFDSFQGTQDSKVHYIISSGDAGGQDTDNYKVSFPDLVLSVSGELKDSLGGGGGVPGPGGSFNFGPTDPSNNTDVVNFNQGENVRMYIDEDGAVNVSEKLVVSDGKETILGGVTTIKDTLTVADGKETILGGVTTIKGETTIQEKLTVANGKETVLGGPVTIKGDSTFEQSAIFTDLTTDPDPSAGKLYRKGDDIYFGGQKLLTDGSGGAGKWSDGAGGGRIHYSGGNVGIGIDNPGSVLEIKGHSDPFSIYDGSGEQKLRVFTASNGSVLALTDGGQDIIRLDGRATTPNDSYFNVGNVGIGITTPDAKLHVSRLDQHETNSALTVVRGDTSLGDRPTAPIFNVFNGQAGGTEVFRVQGNGNVGIGETDPGQKLVVRNHSTTNNRVAIGLSSQDGTQNGSISHIDEEGKERITLSAGGFSVDQLAILNNGNVGIGTTEPDRLLEIFGSVNAGNLTALKLTNNLANDNGESVSIEFGGYGDKIMGLIEARMRSTDSDSDLIFSTNPGTNDTSLSEHMRILANGNVGIGSERASSTSIAVSHSNITPLQVNKPGNEIVPLLTLSNYDHTDNSTSHGSALDFGLARDSGTQKSSSGRIYVGKTEALTNDDASMNSLMSFNIFTENNLSEKMRITSNGVGIGANDPAGPLHIEDLDSHSISLTRKIDITNNSNGAAAKIRGGALVGTSDSYGGAVGFSLYDATTNGSSTGGYLYFETKNEGASLSEKLRITNEGKIGINQPAPTYYIDAKPSNQSDQFVARFTTEHDANMMHSALIFSKTKQNGTATSDGAIIGSLGWEGKDTANTVRSCGMIKVVQRGAANANGRVADMYLHAPDGNLYNNASISNDSKHEKLRLKGGGGVILARLDSAPSTPDAGEMYFNTSDNTFYGYNGTSWKALHS